MLVLPRTSSRPRRGPWRLRPIPDPAQKAEGALAQGQAPEQNRADDGQDHHHLDNGDDLTDHGVEHPDAGRGSECGDPGTY